jgi:hypothetical protein
MHTPGPWCVGDLDQHGQRIVRQEHIEIATCWHHSVGSIEQEMEANARLIAAAPDLLAALSELLPIMQRQLDNLLRTAGDQAEAVFDSEAFKFASARLERARAALSRAGKGDANG